MSLPQVSVVIPLFGDADIKAIQARQAGVDAMIEEDRH
jgi:hypothetical protein